MTTPKPTCRVCLQPITASLPGMSPSGGMRPDDYSHDSERVCIRALALAWLALVEDGKP